MPYRVVASDSGKSRFVQLLPSYTMWGYLYPGTDATGTVRGLATPTPRQAKGSLETIHFHVGNGLLQPMNKIERPPD